MNYRNFYLNLMEAFGDDQKKKWLKDNPELTSDQIDIYIKWFDELRKSKPAAAKTINIDGIPKGDDRFDISKYSDWHSFESFVDAVRAQTQLKGEKLSDNLEVIDGKPLFQKNGLEVYYADTPRACIKYKGSVPYGWCISRTDSSNMFYSYRLRGDNPAFYFVKDVEATQKELSSIEKFTGKFNDKWHFFVIQVLNTANINNLTDKNYVVTSANNEGDIPMNWNEIVKIQPKLNGLQSEFLPKPLSKDELVVLNKYKKGLTTQEFVKLSYNEKERFLDVYPTTNRPITDEMFNELPYELKNKYIGMGIGLSDEQYKSIQSDKNLLKRYVQITEKKFELSSTHPSELDLLRSEIDVLYKSKILYKYVNRLSDKSVNNLMMYSPDRQQMIDTLLNNNVPLTDRNVYTLLLFSPNRQTTIDTLLNKNVPLTDSNMTMLVRYSKNKKQTLDILLNRDIQLTGGNVMFLSKYSKLFDYLSNKNVPLTDNTVLTLLKYSRKKQQMIDFLLNRGLSIDKILTDYNVGSLLSGSPNRGKLIALFLQNNIPLTDRNIRNLLKYTISVRTREKLIDFLFEKNIPLTYDNVEIVMQYSTDTQKTVDALLNNNIALTNKNVNMLLYYSKDPDKTIDTLLNKNVPITDDNVESFYTYSKTNLYSKTDPDAQKLKRKIDALKLKQQLSETKFRYRDFFKDLLLELEFKVVPYSEHPHGFIGWKGKMVWMSPDKFLSLARKLDFPYEDSLESLRHAMKLGQPIPHLMLGVDMVKRKVVDHEGRHRATVAKELGIEKVPVFIYTGNYTRTPSWTEEDHDVVDNLKFDREG